jgi:glycerate 2-kinase
VREILHAAVRAADAGRLVRAALSAPWLVDCLSIASGVNVVAVGKAAGPMLNAFAHGVERPLRIMAGIGPVRPDTLPAGAEWFDSAHPVPDARSVNAARRALDIAAATAPGSLFIVLLSGGASALMALPAEGITLEDKQDTVRRLLKAGATIGELNTVRKHLSAIKGGRLAAATAASVVTLVISDVVGDDLSVIGSGPTMPDASTFADALAVLDMRGGRAAYAAAVVTVLERGQHGELPETPKPEDPRMARSVARIIGGRITALEGAAEAARSLDYDVQVIERPIVGEAREAARAFTADVQRAASTLGRPACIIGAGETTVHVKGSGAGGRNQEFALAMLGNLPGPRLRQGFGGQAGHGLHYAFGSIGTDGIDGPTDAAGAVIDPSTAERAAALGLDAQTFLDNNDSYHFFSALDDLVRTGPTGTNVGDVQVALIA